MKTRFIKFLTVFLLILGPALVSLAQPSPTNQPNGDPPGGGPIGGNAPIGSGIVLLIAMGTAYGIKKSTEKSEEGPDNG